MRRGVELFRVYFALSLLQGVSEEELTCPDADSC